MHLQMSREKKHFTSDGHISMDLREGKAKSDTYRVHSTYLVQKTQELESTTGCVVNLHIVPTWPRGKEGVHKSPNYHDMAHTEEDAVVPPSQDHAYQPAPPSSPQMMLVPPPSATNKDFCGMCNMRYGSSSDKAVCSHWIQCGKDCGCWAHASCHNI